MQHDVARIRSSSKCWRAKYHLRCKKLHRCAVSLTAKQDAAREPQCSHLEHFGETRHLNGFAGLSRVAKPMPRRLWNVQESGVQSAECGVKSVN